MTNAIRVRAVLKQAPRVDLLRFNGIGLAFLGAHDDPTLSPAYFSILWFTVLWIPIAPTGIYLVSHARDQRGREERDRFHVHGRITSRDFEAIYPGSFGRLLRLVWGAFALAAAALSVLIVLAAIAHG